MAPTMSRSQSLQPVNVSPDMAEVTAEGIKLRTLKCEMILEMGDDPGGLSRWPMPSHHNWEAEGSTESRWQCDHSDRDRSRAARNPGMSAPSRRGLNGFSQELPEGTGPAGPVVSAPETCFGLPEL